MSISFKRRLKWYGGIFLIASIVFGVNIFQYEKVKNTYKWQSLFKCSEKYFFDKVRPSEPVPEAKQSKYAHIEPIKQSKYGHIQPAKQSKYAHIEPTQLQPNNPRNGLSKSQIAEAEALYSTCLSNRLNKVQEAKNKKDQTEFMLGAGVILMILSVLVAFIDFIIQFYKKGKITKIGMSRFMIVVSIIWVLVAFSENYRSRGLRIDDFVLVGIVPVVVILGLMWAFGLFKLKDKS